MPIIIKIKSHPYLHDFWAGAAEDSSHPDGSQLLSFATKSRLLEPARSWTTRHYFSHLNNTNLSWLTWVLESLYIWRENKSKPLKLLKIVFLHYITEFSPSLQSFLSHLLQTIAAVNSVCELGCPQCELRALGSVSVCPLVRTSWNKRLEEDTEQGPNVKYFTIYVLVTDQNLRFKTDMITLCGAGICFISGVASRQNLVSFFLLGSQLHTLYLSPHESFLPSEAILRHSAV